MIKKTCRLCGHGKLLKFLDLGFHPPSDQFKSKKQLDEPTIYYPLNVCSCLKCGFKQLDYVVDPKILYQENYPYGSSLTKAAIEHYTEFANTLIHEYQLGQKDLAIDIGSNTGVLLNVFKKNNLKVTGIDPALNMCQVARKKGIPTINSFFNKNSVSKILKKYGKAKIITGTNVFAHVDDLNLFTQNIKSLIDKKKGVFIIEAPHFLHLIKNLEYDTVYHEHLSYITVKPLIPFFKKFNMEIIDVKKRNIHGGSVRITISNMGNFKIKKSVKITCQAEDKSKLNNIKTLLLFQKKVDLNRFKLISLLTKIKRTNKSIVVLSAPAKGMTLLNYCKIDKNYIDYATDKSKIKQGLYTPGLNIPIFSDKKILKTKPDYALLLAWNFSKEIIKNNDKFLKRGGKFIIPIPNLKIISLKK